MAAAARQGGSFEHPRLCTIVPELCKAEIKNLCKLSVFSVFSFFGHRLASSTARLCS